MESWQIWIQRFKLVIKSTTDNADFVSHLMYGAVVAQSVRRSVFIFSLPGIEVYYSRNMFKLQFARGGGCDSGGGGGVSDGRPQVEALRKFQRASSVTDFIPTMEIRQIKAWKSPGHMENRTQTPNV